MQKLNGFRRINQLKFLMTVMTFLVVVGAGGTANADIVIDNQLIPSADINSIVISPASGQINISTTGYTVTRNGTTTPPPANAVAITSFTVSAANITTGQSVTLSWNTSNATVCSASGGSGAWAGSVITLPFGNQPVTPTVGTHTFTLTCQGASTSATRTLNVAVTDPSTTPPPAPNNCATPSLSGNTLTWNNFWGAQFPNTATDTRVLSLARDGFVAIEFNSANISAVGSILLIETTTSPGIRLGAISTCPGDFNVEPICDHVWGLGGGIKWASVDDPRVCSLAPNTNYYLNFTFTNGSNANTTTCTTANCVVRIQTNFNNLQ